MEKEIWKDIKDYEGLYQVSNWGRVKSLNYLHHKKVAILKLYKNRFGYMRVILQKDGIVKNYFVHRLVATAFLENPENLPQVNHKDEDKTNNFVGTPENNYKDGNLEWCDCKYNTNYGTGIKRRSYKTSKKLSKPVLQFTLDGIFIREWESTRECGRNGFHQGHVWSCCVGKQKQHKGYIWKYKEVK